MTHETKVPAVTAESDQQGRGGRSRRILAESGMLVPLVLLIVMGAILSPAFLTMTNFSIVLKISAVIGLLAVGQTFVILAGGSGIDLSVGSVLAASAVVGALFQDYGIAAVVAASLLTGAFFGLVNGLGVTFARLQPFIVTLATLTIARGVAFQLTSGTPIFVKVDGFSWFSDGQIFGVPVPIVILVAVIVVGQLVLRNTVYGRKLYVVGGNDEAAYLSGINVTKLRISVYLISGILAGAAGVLAMARLNTADANFGTGYELSAIAAVVIGGTTLAGGRGSVAETAIGIAIIALFTNLLNLLNISYFTQMMLTGLIVLVVVSLNRKGSSSRYPAWKSWPLLAALVAGGVILYFLTQMSAK